MNLNNQKTNYTWWILVFYLAYFLLLFSWYPLNDSLPGTADVIHHISMFNDYWNRLVSFFTDESIGNALYPESMIQSFTEPYIGEAIIYMFFRILVNSDLVNYYLFIATLYALNALGAFFFFKHFFSNILLAAVLGLCFATSSFLISHMELLNGLPYFLFFISLTLFLKYRKTDDSKLLFVAALVAGLQLYFSAYITLYLGILFLLLLILDFFQGNTKFNLKHHLFAILIGGIIIAPYVYFVFIRSINATAYNPITFDLIGNYSLQLADFFMPLPHNLIYNEEGLFRPEYTDAALKNSNSAFFGFTALLAGIGGLFRKNKAIKITGIMLMTVGLILSVGPYMRLGTYTVPMPLYLFYKYTFIIDFMRIPARIYPLFITGVLLLSGLFLSGLKGRWKNRIAVLFACLFVVENIPLKDDYHKFLSSQLTPPVQLLKYMKAEPKVVTLVNLPSSLYTDKGYSNMLSEYNREFIYTYWQTKHKQNILNGSVSFCPETRNRNNQLIANISDSNSLKSLIVENQLDYIFYHPKLVLAVEEKNILGILQKSNYVKEILLNDSLAIFKVEDHIKD